MKTSERGLAALMQHEGIVLSPYLDSEGIWTYGIGHTKSAGPPDPEKMKKGPPADQDKELKAVLDLFRKDIVKYEDAVNKLIDVRLEQHEFDALVSFHYNTGKLGSSTARARLNKGDKAGTAEALLWWNKPAAIIPRRKKEVELFKNGTYPTGSIALLVANEQGRTRYLPSLSYREVLNILQGTKEEPKAIPVSSIGDGEQVGNFISNLIKLFFNR